MSAWSFSAIRPKLDTYFDRIRLSLEARASDGVDRQRLEDFLGHAQTLKERLYVCLESDDRSDLPVILKDVQVLAYRIRVLFGSPLQGVAWDDLHQLLADLPPPSEPAMRVLEGPRAARVPSGDLRDTRLDVRAPERTLVAPSRSGGGGTLVDRDPPRLPDGLAVPDVSSALAGEVTPPEAPVRLASPEEASSSAGASPLAEDAAPDDAPTPAMEPRKVDLPDLSALPLRIPFLMGVLVFLAGAIAGYSLGGSHPTFTALAGGIAAILATRAERAPVRYNGEAPDPAATPDAPVRLP